MNEWDSIQFYRNIRRNIANVLFLNMVLYLAAHFVIKWSLDDFLRSISSTAIKMYQLFIYVEPKFYIVTSILGIIPFFMDLNNVRKILSRQISKLKDPYNRIHFITVSTFGLITMYCVIAIVLPSAHEIPSLSLNAMKKLIWILSLPLLFHWWFSLMRYLVVDPLNFKDDVS